MLPARVYRASRDPFEVMHREFDTALNRMFGEESGSALAPYAVDVREDADHIYVDAELPGFKKEDVEITLENQTLTISAERHEKPENGEKDGGYLLNERRYTRFLRSFTLPPTLDDKHVDAKLDNGVLTIALTKREETKPRKINVG
jgi:HSP20 family protein